MIDKQTKDSFNGDLNIWREPLILYNNIMEVAEDGEVYIEFKDKPFFFIKIDLETIIENSDRIPFKKSNDGTKLRYDFEKETQSMIDSIDLISEVFSGIAFDSLNDNSFIKNNILQYGIIESAEASNNWQQFFWNLFVNRCCGTARAAEVYVYVFINKVLPDFNVFKQEVVELIK